MFDQKEWRSRNPLKAWREQTGTTQTNAAAMVGVGVQAMQRWESGASMPSDANMDEIAIMMDRYEANDLCALMHEWADWRNELKSKANK